MNSNKLKAVLKENGDRQADLAAYLHMELSTLNQKINGNGTDFRQTEMLAIKRKYNLSADDMDAIFFDVVGS